MQHSAEIVVAGAGVAGSATALLLADLGLEVLLLERAPSPDERGKRHASLNLTLCERGLAAIEHVVPRELLLRASVPLLGRAIHAEDGSVFEQPYSSLGDALHCITRSDLHRVLLEQALKNPRIRVQFNTRVEHYDVDSRQLHMVHGEGESTLWVKHLFAADGLRSRVRRALAERRHFNLSQEYADHGAIELSIPKDRVPKEWNSKALHLWPREDRMAVGFPNRDGSYTCGLNLPLRGEHSFQTLAVLGGGAFLSRYFPELTEVATFLKPVVSADDAIPLASMKCWPWHLGDQVILLGDAAHGMWPTYGQGANAAFESASLLALSLKEHPKNIEEAFSSFARTRKPDTDAISDLCKEHLYELRADCQDQEFLDLKAIERAVVLSSQGEIRPLYELISFTRTPYREAIRVHSRRKKAWSTLQRRRDRHALLEKGPGEHWLAVWRDAEQGGGSELSARALADTAQYLVQRSRPFAEEFRKSRLLKALSGNQLDAPEARQAFLQGVNLFSSIFQNIVFMRQATTDLDHPAFLPFMHHLVEELNHDQILQSHGLAKDALLTALGQWFAHKALTGSPLDKAILLHLVLEPASEIFQSVAEWVFRGPSSKYHELHQALDETHWKDYLFLFQDLSEPELLRSRETLGQAWQVHNYMADRVYALASNLSPPVTEPAFENVNNLDQLLTASARASSKFEQRVQTLVHGLKGNATSAQLIAARVVAWLTRTKVVCLNVHAGLLHPSWREPFRALTDLAVPLDGDDRLPRFDQMKSSALCDWFAYQALLSQREEKTACVLLVLMPANLCLQRAFSGLTEAVDAPRASWDSGATTPPELGQALLDVKALDERLLAEHLSAAWGVLNCFLDTATENADEWPGE